MADETTTGTQTSTTGDQSSTEATQTTEANASSTTEQPKATTETTDESIDLSKAAEGDKPAGEEAKQEGEVEQTDEEKAAAEAKAALFGAPEGDAAYEIEGLPEGMGIDVDALAAVTPAFKELGLSNAGASKIAQVYAEHVLPKVGEQFKTTLEQQVVDQRREWEGDTLKAIKGELELKTSTGDKIDFGGAGVKQVQQVAAKALDRIAPEGFREFLDQTGLGQHPAMVAFAYRVGSLISEDSDFGGGGGGDPTPKTKTQKYYGR